MEAQALGRVLIPEPLDRLGPAGDLLDFVQDENGGPPVAAAL